MINIEDNVASFKSMQLHTAVNMMYKDCVGE